MNAESSDKRVLLPCPFCGSHNVKATIVPNTQGNRRYMYCLGCFAEGPWSRLDANEIELWNRREALSARGDIERDAARYRYIRNTAPWKSAAVAVMSCDVGDDIAMLTHDGLDAIIDNAMTQYVGEKK